MRRLDRNAAAGRAGNSVRQAAVVLAGLGLTAIAPAGAVAAGRPSDDPPRVSHPALGGGTASDVGTDDTKGGPDECHLRGVAALKNGDNDRAIAEFSQAIRLDPRRRRILRTWHRPGEEERAGRGHRRLQRSDPARSALGKAHTCRGAVWLQKNEIDRAIGDLDEAIRLDPRDAKAFSNRGAAWGEKGEFDRRSPTSTRRSAWIRRTPPALCNRGTVWLAKEQLDRALADFDAAIRIDPTAALAYRGRADVWLQKKDYDKAISDYTKAIRLDPRDSLAYVGRGAARERE